MRIYQIWNDIFYIVFISIYYRSLDLFLCFAPGPNKLRDGPASKQPIRMNEIDGDKTNYSQRYFTRFPI